MGYRRLIVGDGGRYPIMVEAGYVDRSEKIEDFVEDFVGEVD